MDVILEGLPDEGFPLGRYGSKGKPEFKEIETLPSYPVSIKFAPRQITQYSCIHQSLAVFVNEDIVFKKFCVWLVRCVF